MKAVRLHEYGLRPVIEQVPEPAVSGPLDVIVRIGGAGCAARTSTWWRASGEIKR
jgi:threonine dehydrogenase-like Zn-dependent dehydrogenase